MATTMYDRSSNVEEFLKNHRSKLDEDKTRLQRRESDGFSISGTGGILPSDEGRLQSLRQKRDERHFEYQKYLQDNDDTPKRRRNNDQVSANRLPSVREIRKELQKEREKEVMFVDEKQKEYSKRSVADNIKTTPTQPKKDSVVGLGRIGYAVEESPEEKRQRQSRYREELMKQMKEKNKESLVKKKMGTARIFEDDDQFKKQTARRQRRPLSPKEENREWNRDKYTDREYHHFDIGHDNEDGCYGEENNRYGDSYDDNEDLRFNQRPSKYRNYPQYSPPRLHPPPAGPHPPLGLHPPPGPHPPPGQHPSSQFGYYPSYYYPPHYYPPPMLPHPPPGPAPPHHSSYYPSSLDNPYMRRHNKDTPISPSHSRQHSPPHRSTSPSFDYRTNKESKGNLSGIPQSDSKAEFRAFLDKQVKEKKAKEAKEKRERDKFYRKIDAEAEIYDPWGKPGGGAPLTDAIGNVVTERGQLRKSYDDNLSPRLSEEDRKKLVQEKTKKQLEEQIKENKERQMKEKYELQRLEELEDKKIKEELDRLNIQGKEEIKEEKKKKQQQEELEKEKQVLMQPLSAQELAEKRFKEELEKKKMKEKEEKERLDRLADNMAARNTPAWRQQHRAPSPPIPTLNKKQSSNDAFGQAIDQPLHQQQPVIQQQLHQQQLPQQQLHQQQLPQQRLPQQQLPQQQLPQQQLPQQHVPHSTSLASEAYREDHTHLNAGSHAHHVTARPDQVQTNIPGQVPSTSIHSTSTVVSPRDIGSEDVQYTQRNSRPSSLRRTEDSHMTSGHMTDQSVSSTEVLPRHNAVQQGTASEELMRGFSDLKKHIRRTMSSSSTGVDPQAGFPRRRSSHVQPSRPTMKQITDTRHPNQPQTLQQITDESRRNENNANDVARQQRLFSGLSNMTVATAELDSLVNRNEERRRRLESIFNADNRQTQSTNPREIVHEFLQRNPNQAEHGWR